MVAGQATVLPRFAFVLSFLVRCALTDPFHCTVYEAVFCSCVYNTFYTRRLTN